MSRRSDQITIQDIANELGITSTTVSRALNDKPDIASETKERILETAERMGYVRSALARDLASGYLKAIGCVVTTIADPYIDRILEGIEEVAQDAGFAMLVTTGHAVPNRESAAIDRFLSYRVAGVISTSSWITQRQLSQLRTLGVPIILINSEVSGPDTNSIRVDDLGAAKSAVTHLLDLGHRRIAHITITDGSVSSRMRWQSYRKTLEAHNLVYDPGLVVETEESEAGGGDAMLRLLDKDPRPTAVFCYNDRIAIGALHSLHRAGVRVPQEMSLVGIDDIAVAAWIWPALTTVHQPSHRMGRTAMEMMLKLLDREEKVGDIVVPGELIVRASTDVAATQ